MNKHDSSKKSSHLTIGERNFIEEALRVGRSPYWLSQHMKRSLSTITREIKGRSIESDKSASGFPRNQCALRDHCMIHEICGVDCIYGYNYKCSRCKICNERCPDFVKIDCLRLKRSPYVCNGCPKEKRCSAGKRYYIAKVADEVARKAWSEKHSGFNLSEEELRELGL